MFHQPAELIGAHVATICAQSVALVGRQQVVVQVAAVGRIVALIGGLPDSTAFSPTMLPVVLPLTERGAIDGEAQGADQVVTLRVNVKVVQVAVLGAGIDVEYLCQKGARLHIIT